MQFDACIPDFALQEYTGESDPPKRDMVKKSLVLKDGYLEVPDAPGLTSSGPRASRPAS